MRVSALKLFALDASREFGERVAQALGVDLAAHEEREFEDGEHKVRPLESVRGQDVYVIQSLYSDANGSVNDKLIRMLFFLGALRDAGAARLTAVIPYLCYSRKDRRTKSRDPLTTRYVAGLIEAVGVECVMTVDVHNLAAFENAFRIRTEHIEAKKLFVEHFAGRLGDTELVVVSPDVGGIKRAEAFREALERRLDTRIGSAFMEKARSGGVVSGETLVGDVSDRTLIILDDLISSGGTIERTARAAAGKGARAIHAAAAHGLFVGDADAKLAEPALTELVISDTVPPFRLSSQAVHDKLTVVDAASLLAEAIHRDHTGGSIVELLEV